MHPENEHVNYKNHEISNGSLQEAKAKAANEEGKIEQIALNQREEGEGDLFGIRALERGFTGGVAQSRPSTPNPHMSTSTLVPSAVNIPFGQKSVGSATSSVITIDVGNPKPVQPAVTSDRIAPQFAKRSDVAVDMQLAVPESPRLPRSPESPKFPRETTRSPSPLSHNLPHLDSTIPSGGLGLNSYAQSSASGARKIQSKSPLEVNVPTRGISIISNAASVVDEDSPPGSPSRSSHHSNGSQSGPSTNFSRPPPSPPRGVYQTHRPQIKVDAPRSDSPSKSPKFS